MTTMNVRKAASIVPTLIRCGLIVTLVFALTGVSTGAIIDGEFDGNHHPYVGAAILGFEGLCSGSAISPTLFVTAAHCFHATPGQRVAVSFDADIFGERDGDPVPHFVTGTFHPDPQFCGQCGPALHALPGFRSHDSAVVVLDEPVDLARYAQLPSEGQIEALANRTRVGIVGYGIVTRLKDFDPTTDTIPRNMAEAELNPGTAALGPDFVKLSANPSQGKGRICAGDSGGPVLRDDTILATTSLGITGNCIGVAYAYRLDTADALAFIGQFLDAPSGQVAAESVDQRGPTHDAKAVKKGGKSGQGKHGKRGR